MIPTRTASGGSDRCRRLRMNDETSAYRMRKPDRIRIVRCVDVGSSCFHAMMICKVPVTCYFCCFVRSAQRTTTEWKIWKILRGPRSSSSPARTRTWRRRVHRIQATCTRKALVRGKHPNFHDVHAKLPHQHRHDTHQPCPALACMYWRAFPWALS
jgi:hypothetical protein